MNLGAKPHRCYLQMSLAYPACLVLLTGVANCTAMDLKANLTDNRFKEQLALERKALIEGLISIVKDGTSPMNVRVRAVEILGDVRASEATGALVTYIVEIRYESWKEIGTQYPCLSALIKIGKPASQAAIKELGKPMTDIRRWALAVVLAEVEGRKVARFMIQEEIADAKPQQEHENLQKALDVFVARMVNEPDVKEK